MKLIVTHALPETGSNFHKQKLYYVPRETVQQIASDFKAFKKESPEENASDAPACKTYEYALDAPQDDDTARPDETDDSTTDGETSNSETDPPGLLSVDPRTAAAV